MNDSDTERAEAIHDEYMSEARQLIAAQIDKLYRMVTDAATMIATGTHGAPRIEVSRDGNDITASCGGRTMRFHAESIADVPEGGDPANEFPGGQARCTIQMPDGATETWVLHRTSIGTNIQYAWLHAKTQALVGETELTETLRQALTR